MAAIHTQARDTVEPESIAGARWLSLTGGGFALVDENEFARAAERPWTLCHKKNGVDEIVHGRNDGTEKQLSRFIVGASENVWVDHRNGNRLDNRRSNLRVATPRQNAQNKMKRRQRGGASSRFKGVSARQRPWHTETRYEVSICVGGRRLFVGSFTIEEDAARAYDAAARQHYGEFACVNFPKDGERSALVASSF